MGFGRELYNPYKYSTDADKYGILKIKAGQRYHSKYGAWKCK